MKKIRNFALAALCLLVSAGCQTMEGVKRDFRSVKMPAVSARPAATSENLIQSGLCPAAEIVPDLAFSRHFTDAPPPGAAGTLVAEAALTDVVSTCSYNDLSMTVEIKLVFEAAAGPAALPGQDQPFPYFVAVVSPENEILAKEVFAAPIEYDALAVRRPHYETLRQIVPIASREQGAAHKILAGFQLSPEQLQHNRGLIADRRAAAGRGNTLITAGPPADAVIVPAPAPVEIAPMAPAPPGSGPVVIRPMQPTAPPP